MRKSNKKGFTVVELVIVIAIIAILAAVLIPTFASLIQKANESNDIQAAKNMNTFLAAANVTGDVKSILDVYDIFEESGFAVENYTPLYKDRYYFYDKEYNQILYVDGDGKVLYPTEHKGETNTKSNWMSLSMTVKKAQPKGEYYKAETGKITATVKSGEEYAFVINEYNKAADGTALDLTINGTIDMMGAACFIENSKGDITITGGTNAVIKNMTSNRAVTVSDGNAQKIAAQYRSGALVASLNKNNSLTITNVTFENLNVKAIYAGGVSTLVGCSEGTINLSNVTIKNSTVIGHRDVGAVVGQASAAINVKGDVTLDNVNVMTVGGRAALFGRLYNTTTLTVDEGAKLINNNSKVSIYESKVSEQKFVDGALEAMPDGWNENAWKAKITIKGQERYIYSVKKSAENGDKTYSVYGYNPDAVIIRGYDEKSEWTAFTTLDAEKTNG